MAKSEKKKSAARRPKVQTKAGGKLSDKTESKVTAKPRGKAKKIRVAKIVALPVVSDAVVLDRLFAVVQSRRDADPTVSHSARLLSRGRDKVAQKFGEEAVECLIEAVAGNREALIGESADVLYHLLVLWVSSGVNPAEVWAELIRREGISGIAEKAARAKPLITRASAGTPKIP